MAFFSTPSDPSAFDMCGSCGHPRVSCKCGAFRLFTAEDFDRWLRRVAMATKLSSQPKSTLDIPRTKR